MMKFTKQLPALALCGALLCPTAFAVESVYTDVPAGAWYESAVEYCRVNGVMGGSGGRFSPEGKVTRASLAAVLFRLSGAQEAAGESGFTDVPADAWYAGAVAWASQSGAMGGYGDGLFGPEDPLTREQLAVVFWRQAGRPEARAEDFADEADINASAQAAVDWARSTGLMGGVGENRFAPGLDLTRAQLAAVVMRYATRGGVSVMSAMDVMCQPCGLAAMEDGSLLVTDRYNKLIWRVSGGKATVFAGSDTVEDVYGQPIGGYHDAGFLESSFRDPWAVSPFLDGWAVSDAKNGVVRFLRTGDSEDAHRSAVTDLGIKFDHPTGLATDGEGNLYVAETFQGLIKKITPGGKVTTLVDNLSEPMGLCWADGALYVAESGGNRILRVSARGQLTVVAGSGENGYADGPAKQAAFSGPKGVAVDADGTVYAADTDNGAVRRIRDGQVTTILSRDPADATVLYPASPTGLLLRGDTLYISDTFARKLLALPLT